MNVSVTSQQISATAAGTAVNASVTSATVTATASGGIGPSGAVVGTLSQLQDVELVNAATGDLLRRDGAKWKNYPERGLILDGGNW